MLKRFDRLWQNLSRSGKSLRYIRDNMTKLRERVTGLEAKLKELNVSLERIQETDKDLRGQLENLRYELGSAQRRLLLAQGAVLRTIHRHAPNLKDAEFRIFSQFGEDGIISYLIENIDIANRTFIEFGVEDFNEANCRFLLEDRNWSGFVIDGSTRNIERLTAWGEYWKYSLQARSAFINRDNISNLLAESGFSPDLGILSIDIDGVDYWVASQLTNWHPRILIMEYNAVFGRDRAVTIPYSENFQRTRAHYSNLYWGASLKALIHLAAPWGYALVGTNSAGNNAFFVRRDLLNQNVSEKSLEEAFTDSKYRESRDANGGLNFISSEARLKEISGLPVVNVETGGTETL